MDKILVTVHRNDINRARVNTGDDCIGARAVKRALKGTGIDLEDMEHEEMLLWDRKEAAEYSLKYPGALYHYFELAREMESDQKDNFWRTNYLTCSFTLDLANGEIVDFQMPAVRVTKP